MRAFALLTGFAAIASAQVLTVEEINDVPLAPDTTVPDGAGSQVVHYSPAEASASAFADAYDDHFEDAGPSRRLARAALVLKEKRTQACGQLPQGYGPQADPDTPEAFLASTDLSNSANNANTPAGYVQTYQNLQGATSTSGYLGYKSYKSYDPAQCAADCTAKTGCLSFNIFYERAPSIDPADACPNPASTTLIKCSFWGNTIHQPSATNTGQWRGSQFRVVIAGSNGYRLASPTYNLPGYESKYLGESTINSPTECGSYMTVKTFSDGQPFDPARCSAACAAESAYNLRYRPESGTCQFFTTYLLLKNDAVRFQACALYKSSWDESYSVNRGYYSGNDHYTIEYSYSYKNATNAGTDKCSA